MVDNKTWYGKNYTAQTFANEVQDLLNKWIVWDAPFPLGRQAAFPSVVVEEYYLPSDQVPHNVAVLLGWPLILEVHIVFGRSFLMELWDGSLRVRYWLLRNGTSLMNSLPNNQSGLPQDVEAFIDGQVQSSLSKIIYHSDRVAQALGTPVLRADWLIAGQPGPRLHGLRYFWERDFDVHPHSAHSEHENHDGSSGHGPELPALGQLMAATVQAGFACRNELEKLKNYSRSFSVEQPAFLAGIHCTLPSSGPLASGYSNLYCGPAPPAPAPPAPPPHHVLVGANDTEVSPVSGDSGSPNVTRELDVKG